MEVKKKKYMSGKDLYCEILVSKAKGKLTPRAAQMLMLLGKKLQSKMYYKNSDDKKDCLQEAMLSVFKFWYNFDELKGDNAFAYYSEVIKRGLAQGWNKMYRLKGDKDGNFTTMSLDQMTENLNTPF
jgi:DNA-directed RNA polymerase specialized sigma24 family protein